MISLVVIILFKGIIKYHLNLSLISLVVSPLVSITLNQLMKPNRMVTPPKIKNTGYGLPAAFVMNGVTITQIEHPNQFMKVAGGTILAGIISGT